MTTRISAAGRLLGATLAERIIHNSDVNESGCWLWKLMVDRHGYPQMNLGRGRKAGAHRASYAEFVGPIPADMTVDHLCFVPTCVNPEHLRLLSREDNSARQRRALAELCERGHEFTADNTGWQKNHHRYGAETHRFCRTCRRETARARRAAQRSSA